MNHRHVQKKSIMQRALQVMGAAVVFCAAVGAGVLAYEFVRDQKYLIVKEVKVEGIQTIQESEILDYAQIELGESLYRVNTDLVLRNVLKHPDVQAATVSRVPPDAIRIVVQEQVPVAAIAVGQGIYVVNRDGKMFRRAQAGEALDLPPVTGIPREMFTSNKDKADKLLALAMRAMKAHQESGRNAQELGEIEVDEFFGITLQLGEPTVEVALGMDGFAEKFARLRTLETHLKKKNQKASRIFLDNARHPERVAVELAQPFLAAASPAPAHKPSTP